MPKVQQITSSDLENGMEFIIDNENPYTGTNYLEIQYLKTSTDDEKIHFWIKSDVDGVANDEPKPYQLISTTKTMKFEMDVFIDGKKPIEKSNNDE